MTRTKKNIIKMLNQICGSAVLRNTVWLKRGFCKHDLICHVSLMSFVLNTFYPGVSVTFLF